MKRLDDSKIRLFVLIFIGSLFISGSAAADSNTDTGGIRITILYDNYVLTEGCRADWGFSCMVLGTEKNILFDAGGDGSILLYNMDTLEVDANEADYMVISHNHGDHTGSWLPNGGVFSFLSRNSDVTVYLPPSVPSGPIQDIEAAGASTQVVNDTMQLCEGVHLTGPMGTMVIEQSMVLDTPKGLVVITGCAHPGIVNIVQKAKDMLDKDVYFVYGGFHLINSSDSSVRSIIRQLKELGVQKVGASHCTGDRAIELFRQEYAENFVPLGAGHVEIPNRCDFNGDGVVDIDDMVIFIESWNSDRPQCDIAPGLFGDGVVDINDLLVLAEHLTIQGNDPNLSIIGPWTQKADMPTARLGVSASVVDGKIYAIGGYRAANSPGMRTVEEYDPSTDTWTTKANMPTGRRWLSSSAVNGKIYAFGGYTNLDQPGLSANEEYDPATDNWTTRAPMPTARLGVASCVVDGIIYVIGGALSVAQGPVTTVEAYDPLTDTWTRKADMPTARFMLSTSVVDGKIYAIGGQYGQGRAYTKVEQYDPATDTWTTKADMLTARAGLASCVVNGRIYAVGGADVADVFSTIEQYDPATDTWTQKTDMPIGRLGLAAGVVDGKIYAVGGASRATGGHPGVRTVHEYNPILPADFNKDNAVDVNDLVILIENWGTDEPLCDIAPALSGDGIVDINDLELFLYYWELERKDPTLIAHWKLDETDSDVAYDSAGEHDGTINGDPLWQPEGGMVDGALQFDGADDYISTPFVLNPEDVQFSVFVWIKGGSPGQVVLSQTGGADWLLADPSDGKLMTALSRPASGRIPATPLVSESIITDNAWHRTGFVWDGSYRRLYVDGAEVAMDAVTLSGLESAEGGLYLGAGSTLAPETFFSGLIDDVRIYNRAITP